jgi:polysaccharide biosynthesis transport protein
VARREEELAKTGYAIWATDRQRSRVESISVEPSPDGNRDDMREYARILWRRRGEIVLVTAALFVVVLLFTYLQPSAYASSASVLVGGMPVPGSSAGVLQTPNMDTERALVLQSREIADRARASTGAPLTVEELLENVEAEVVPNTEILTITYSDPNPERAARMAQSFADAYLAFRVSEATSEISAAATPIESQIAQFDSRIQQVQRSIERTSSPAEQRRLRNQLNGLTGQLGVLERRLLSIESNLEVALHSSSIVSPAQVQTTPSSLARARSLLIAPFVGLVFGVGIALLRERLDERVKSSEELERALGVPVLGVIPRVSGWSDARNAHLEVREDPSSRISESYRMLAANVLALASREHLSTFVVTSAVRGEGKTTTSSNLSAALAELGKRVVAVSADVRHPRLHDFFGLTNDVGLSDLRGDSRTAMTVERDPGIPNLLVVSSGPGGDGAPLDSDTMKRALTSLKKGAEFLVIDSPPVLEAVDASVLARVVDGVVLVVDGRSTLPMLVRSVTQLRQTGGSVIGVVYNNTEQRTAGHRASL